MSKTINILDKEYVLWVQSLVERYRQSQIKAAIKVNTEQLRFNWLLGRDIVEMKVEQRWGEGVIERLSRDLKENMPLVEGLSVTNLRYCRRFYLLYSKAIEFHPQLGGEIKNDAITEIRPQAGGELSASHRSQWLEEIFKVPWGHHKLILDKVKGDVDNALFFITQTLENGWSRAINKATESRAANENGTKTEQRFACRTTGGSKEHKGGDIAEPVSGGEGGEPGTAFAVHRYWSLYI